MERVVHKTLSCGIEFAAIELPSRRPVAIEFRFRAGTAHEPTEALGVARLIQETIDLGTERYDGRGLSDAFDEIGASHGGWTGRESTGCHCTVLPEFVDRAVELHAEFLRKPTFPEESVRVAKELTGQELAALEDDPQGLLDKYLDARVYGPVLGRHPLGEPETVEGIDRSVIERHWQATYGAGRLQVCAAGPVEADKLAEMLERRFEGFGSSEVTGKETIAFPFGPGTVHHEKDLEQLHMGIAFAGVPLTNARFAVQRVMVAVLSGGMSSRLFTEVREKQGLVYWVSAWVESPRGAGVVFLAASSTPERSEQTLRTLGREVERLGEDLTEEEVRRASAGLVAKLTTRGELTRVRCSSLAEDVFHLGRYKPPSEKIAELRGVGVADIESFLGSVSREEQIVVTLGPKAGTSDGQAVRSGEGVSDEEGQR